MVDLFLMFYEATVLFSVGTGPVYIPNNVHESSFFSTPLPQLLFLVWDRPCSCVHWTSAGSDLQSSNSKGHELFSLCLLFSGRVMSLVWGSICEHWRRGHSGAGVWQLSSQLSSPLVHALALPQAWRTAALLRAGVPAQGESFLTSRARTWSRIWSARRLISSISFCGVVEKGKGVVQYPVGGFSQKRILESQKERKRKRTRWPNISLGWCLEKGAHVDSPKEEIYPSSAALGKLLFFNWVEIVSLLFQGDYWWICFPSRRSLSCPRPPAVLF